MERPLVAGFLALLFGCSRAGAGAVAGSGPSTVHFAIAADPTSLNPLFIHPDAASVQLQLARLQFEPFLDLDPAGHAIPALLDRVPTPENGGISPDGQTIVFHLRPGVRWSDGVPVTSRDVLFTLRAILDPHNPVLTREGYDLIDRASASGPQTVTMHLRRAWAPAATTFFSYGTSTQFVLPAHVLERETALAQAPFNALPNVGDGPYLVTSWQRGNGLTYRANPRYWRGPARTAALDVRIATDPGTNLVMLRTGSLDWNLIAPAQYATVKDDARLQFDSVPTAVVAAVAINTAHAPFDDARVRRALAQSIDRNAISSKITLGK